MPESQATLTSASNIDRFVVDRMAGARCDQEQRCNNVGNGQKYASRQVCMDQQRGTLANDLNAYECPHGIDENALNRCMAAISTEQCGNPFDTVVRRYDKCRNGALCIK
jgi:hypothetical protein